VRYKVAQPWLSLLVIAVFLTQTSLFIRGLFKRKHYRRCQPCNKQLQKNKICCCSGQAQRRKKHCGYVCLHGIDLTCNVEAKRYRFALDVDQRSLLCGSLTFRDLWSSFPTIKRLGAWKFWKHKMSVKCQGDVTSKRSSRLTMNGQTYALGKNLL